MTALVKTTEGNIVEMVKVLFPHLASVSDTEIRKAISLAKHLGLDPAKRECHFIPFKGSLQLVVSYMEYIKRAEKSGKLNGWDVVVGEDEIDVFAEVVIYRKDWQFPLKWRVYLSEAKKDTPSWKSMPIFMLKKVCIAQAFRLAFPEEIATLPYTEDELSNNEVETPAVKTPVETQSDVISEAQRKRLWAIASNKGKEKGLSNEAIETIIRSVLAEYNLKHTSEILKKDYDKIIEKIETEIEEIAREGGNEE